MSFGPCTARFGGLNPHLARVTARGDESLFRDEFS